MSIAIPVPEPAAGLLAICAAIVAGFFHRRRPDACVFATASCLAALAISLLSADAGAEILSSKRGFADVL